MRERGRGRGEGGRRGRENKPSSGFIIYLNEENSTMIVVATQQKVPPLVKKLILQQLQGLPSWHTFEKRIYYMKHDLIEYAR